MLVFVPSGNIGVVELVQMAIQALYGREAVAPAHVYQGKGKDSPIKVVSSTGQEIDYRTYCTWHDGTRDFIQEGLARGECHAFVMTTEGLEWAVPLAYWDAGAAWGTMVSGALEYENEPTLHGRAVYLRNADCFAFVERLRSAAASAEVGESEPQSRNTMAARTKCQKWLVSLMQADSRPTKNKAKYQTEAVKEYGVSVRGFQTAWEAAILETGSKDWKKPGRKPKS